MVRHKGGKPGKAAKILANPKSSKAQKSKAAKILKAHQDKKH